MKLANYVSGRWSEGLGSGELLLVDPVTGEELASITSQGIDLEASTEMWCPVVCTVAREGPARARSLPACVRCCSITAVSSCKDQPIASGNCRDCALTVHSYIHNHHLLLQALRLVPLERNL